MKQLDEPVLWLVDVLRGLAWHPPLEEKTPEAFSDAATRAATRQDERPNIEEGLSTGEPPAPA